ncbi:hypothetical protein C5S36_00890 [Candidatus Methanophagaceae archaeon]|nr:hypothetical protein C5S36_00890 [Methanophagales archaeon]
MSHALEQANRRGFPTGHDYRAGIDEIQTVEHLLQQGCRNQVLEKHVQKRLRIIKRGWELFTAFYFVKGAPATNNGVENYYSTSLKTHRKKQLRSDRGLDSQIKLSAMKRAGLLGSGKKSLLEAFLMFIPFLDSG